MPDPINTGTALIEEVALLPESLQLESEPWTCFFTVAAIIRELRKASNPVTVFTRGQSVATRRSDSTTCGQRFESLEFQETVSCK
jgi:hypothetical protein